NKSIINFLQEKYQPKRGKELVIDIMFMTHTDRDHSKGLSKISNDKNIRVKKFYHNGIIRLDKEKIKKNKKCGADQITTEIGLVEESVKEVDKKYPEKYSCKLVEIYDDIREIKNCNCLS